MWLLDRAEAQGAMGSSSLHLSGGCRRESLQFATREYGVWNGGFTLHFSASRFCGVRDALALRWVVSFAYL